MNAKELASLWEPLAARCPELRPFGLRHEYGWTVEPPHVDLEDGYVGYSLSAELAAALWRDAAVRWLAESSRVDSVEVHKPTERDPQKSCWAEVASSGGYCVWMQWADGVDLDSIPCDDFMETEAAYRAGKAFVTAHTAPTLDHALAAAVKAVQDATMTATDGVVP